MSKIAIIADTACDLSKEYYENNHVEILPLWVNFSTGSYRDIIDLEKKTIYEMMDEELPKTSTPSPGEIKALIDECFKKGYDEVLIITISSGLSGIHNLSNLIAKEYQDKVKVFDTKNIAIGSGFYAIHAVEMRNQGKSMDEIINALETVKRKGKSCCYYTIPSLYHLTKGGRIGLVAGIIGGLLQFKPIIACNQEGIYYAVDKVRGFHKAQKTLIERVKKELSGMKNYYFSICHGDNLEALENATNELKEYIDHAKLFVTHQIAPTLTVHTGKGLLGIAYYILD